jgi:predicted nucleotidyltransferase
MFKSESSKESQGAKPDPVLQALIAHASSENDISALWLYGSRARGDDHANSDYDLAVLFSNRLSDPFEARVRPEVRALQWAETLALPENTLSVVDIALCPIPLGISVLKEGQLMIDKDPSNRFREESRILSRWEIDYLYHQQRFGGIE